MSNPVTPPAGESAPRPLLAWGEAPALDAFETMMWRLDRYPNLRSAVVAVEILDREPNAVRVRAAHAWGAQAIPRLRQKLVEVPLGTPEWVDDPDFDVNRHLAVVAAGAPGGLRRVLDIAQAFALEPFADDRPPWAARVVTGLEHDRAAYILKLHHAMSDGIGIVQLLSFLHSRQREANPGRWREMDPQAPLTKATPPPAVLLARQWRRQIAHAPQGLGALIGRARGALMGAGASDSLTSQAMAYLASLRRVMAPDMAEPSPLLAARNHQWRFEALSFPFAAFRAAAKACDATLNDAFIAGLLGGFARYHQHFGVDVDEMPIGLPISVRKEGDAAGGNRFAPGQLVGLLGQATPQERMRHIGEQVARLKQEPALAAPLAVMPLLTRLPSGMVAKAMGPKMAANDLQASNVPGIREPVYLAGAQVVEFYPYAPLPGVPAMVTLLTHGDQCCVGLNLDSAAITDPDAFMRCQHESFDEILELGRH